MRATVTHVTHNENPAVVYMNSGGCVIAFATELAPPHLLAIFRVAGCPRSLAAAIGPEQIPIRFTS